MSDPTAANDPKAELEAAAVYDDQQRLRGHNVITKDGNLVLLRPGMLALGADVDRGVHITGLKDGQRLATAEDVALKAEMEERRKAREGKR